MSEKKYIDLIDFLKKNKTIPENNFTHTALGQPPHSYPGSYCVEESDNNLFYNLYNKYIFEDNNECYLTEKHKDLSPLLIDLDLRHSINKLERHYDSSFIEIFLEIYVTIIKEIIPAIDNNKPVAFVLEKDTPNFRKNNGLFKDGIHIMFPYIVTDAYSQLVLRRKVVK